MNPNPQIAFLNDALRTSDSPASLASDLLARFLSLPEDERIDMATALIMELGARELARKFRS